MARAINKGAPGQQMGAMTGLSPVPRGGLRAKRVAAAGGGTLTSEGAFYMQVGTFAGADLSGSGFNTLWPDDEDNQLTDSTAASWDNTLGRFTINRAGLWVLFAYVILDGSVTDGAVHVQTPLFTDGPAVLYRGYAGDLGGGYSIGGGLTSAPVVGQIGDHFSADVHLTGSGVSVIDCQFVLYPIAYFA